MGSRDDAGKPKTSCGTMGCLILILLVGGLWLVGNGAKEGSPPPAIERAHLPSPTPDPGEAGYLGGLGLRNGVWMAFADEDWDVLVDAQNEGHRRNVTGERGALEPLRVLAEAGRISIFPLGSKVRVIKAGFASLFVEVLESSDPTDVGKKGWVQFELVQRDPAKAMPSPR